MKRINEMICLSEKECRRRDRQMREKPGINALKNEWEWVEYILNHDGYKNCASIGDDHERDKFIVNFKFDLPNS